MGIDYYARLWNSEIDILKVVNTLCYDNGRRFVQQDRLHAIEDLLEDTPYRQRNKAGLFLLYMKKRHFSDLPKKVLLVSSHIDCKNKGQEHITKCFTEDSDPMKLRGTFDNSITNAALLVLMRKGLLPDNVLISFTGDEEEDSAGAYQTNRYLIKHERKYFALVLDVTSEGWQDAADFTIENMAVKKPLEKKIIKAAMRSDYIWRFVPKREGAYPDYLEDDVRLPGFSWPDESWDYAECDVDTMSFCLPVNTEGDFDMHSDRGVEAYKMSFHNYIEALRQMIVCLAKSI